MRRPDSKFTLYVVASINVGCVQISFRLCCIPRTHTASLISCGRSFISFSGQAGEALLNDGAAIVFFSIFSERYFYELEGLGLGEDVDFGRGVSIFCQKALGAVASGIFFGLGLLFFMYIFHKRFDREENVVEVTAVRTTGM